MINKELLIQLLNENYDRDIYLGMDYHWHMSYPTKEISGEIISVKLIESLIEEKILISKFPNTKAANQVYIINPNPVPVLVGELNSISDNELYDQALSLICDYFNNGIVPDDKNSYIHGVATTFSAWAKTIAKKEKIGA